MLLVNYLENKGHVEGESKRTTETMTDYARVRVEVRLQHFLQLNSRKAAGV